MKKVLNEFKIFISKGNVVDLAVGVVIGSAFSKIVTSLVDDIIMPLVGLIIGGVDFTSLSIKIKDATINYGNFIQNVVDFLIVAFCIFLFVRAFNKVREDIESKMKKEEKEEVKKEAHVELLEEIRDLLIKNKKTTK